MRSSTDLDRRKPLPTNHVFEAHDDFDLGKTWFLHVFGDETDTGVHLNIVEDVGEPGWLNIKHFQWLNAAQCREFGEALIKVADKADALGI